MVVRLSAADSYKTRGDILLADLDVDLDLLWLCLSGSLSNLFVPLGPSEGWT